MNWRFQLYVTLAAEFAINFRQWSIGFNVADERKKPPEPYDFVMFNVFVLPIRVSLMWEPMRREQLASEAHIQRLSEELERDIKALEERRVATD